MSYRGKERILQKSMPCDARDLRSSERLFRDDGISDHMWEAGDSLIVYLKAWLEYAEQLCLELSLLICITGREAELD